VSKAEFDGLMYAIGVSGFLGADVNEVMKSKPYNKWLERRKDFLQNPVKYYKQSIEHKKKLIERYKVLIEKHKARRMAAKTVKQINYHTSMIREYERRIEKLKKSIKWLEVLIKFEKGGEL